MNNNGKQTHKGKCSILQNTNGLPRDVASAPLLFIKRGRVFCAFINKEKEMGSCKGDVPDVLAGLFVGGVVFVVLMNAGELISRLVLSLI